MCFTALPIQKTASFGTKPPPEPEEDELTIDKAKVENGDTIFEWSGGNGVVTIKDADTDTVICSGSDGDCASNLNLTGTAVYAEDEDGNISSNVTVT